MFCFGENMFTVLAEVTGDLTEVSHQKVSDKMEI